ncbi:Uncharacterised protein [Mycobacteroides abscessus subsp. abscessus]|nr:Uncharacterised protein [Mycobacteroides abscessus subsp. abscessus]
MRLKYPSFWASRSGNREMTRPGSERPSERNGVAVNSKTGRVSNWRMMAVHVVAGAW